MPPRSLSLAVLRTALPATALPLRTVRPALRFGLLASVITALAVVPAAAELKLETLPDGSHRITTATPQHRQKRTAGRLVQVRDGTLRATIDRHSRGVGLPARLVQAVMQAESGYNPRALSRVGAMGLMQLMPETARELGVRDPWDPDQNVRGGARYLRQMIDRFGGDLQHGLAAYNAGPTAVDRYGGIPPYRETQGYVRKVLSLYHGTSAQALDIRVPRAARSGGSTTSAAKAPLKITRAADGTYIFTTEGPKPQR